MCGSCASRCEPEKTLLGKSQLCPTCRVTSKFDRSPSSTTKWMPAPMKKSCLLGTSWSVAVSACSAAKTLSRAYTYTFPLSQVQPVSVCNTKTTSLFSSKFINPYLLTKSTHVLCNQRQEIKHTKKTKQKQRDTQTHRQIDTHETYVGAIDNSAVEDSRS